MSPVQAFAAFNLPALVVQKIFENADYVILVNMAGCSTQHRQTVREILKGKLARESRVNVLIEDTVRTVEVTGPNRKKFAWKCLMPRHPEAADIRDFVVRLIDGVEMRVCIKEHEMITVSRNFEQEFVHWAKFLKDVFQCRMGTVALSAKWDTKFDLILRDPVFFECEKLIIRPFAIRPDEMEYVLNNYRAYNFQCQGNPGKVFRYPNPIIYPSIEFEHAQFLTLENFIQMTKDCKRVKVAKFQISGEDVNNWIKMWLSSEATTLEKLEIKLLNNETNPLIIATVLDGISAVATPAVNPYADKDFNRIRSQRASYDIRRADGLPATFMLSQEYKFPAFEFFVWHKAAPQA